MLLFLYQKPASFIQSDLRIVKAFYPVKEQQYSGNIKSILQIFFLIIHSEVSFCWFGKLHAFWAVLFSLLLRKKTIVVAGGDDVACDAKIKYGNFLNPIKKLFGYFIFRNADLVLAVSQFTLGEVLHNAKVSPGRVKLVYHGFDYNYFKKGALDKKTNTVVTVGRITSETLIVKGLVLFVEAARFLPDVAFLVVGPYGEEAMRQLSTVAPPNVVFTGPLYGENLIKVLSTAKVYVQASWRESFGCSVAEAMLCECVPVITNRGALPEVVGDCGFCADDMTSADIADKVKEALVSSEELGKAARARIMDAFPIEKRENELREAINALLKAK
jgi:glycosyltransferase involved in cell wall biosynthesis